MICAGCSRELGREVFLFRLVMVDPLEGIVDVSGLNGSPPVAVVLDAECIESLIQVAEQGRDEPLSEVPEGQATDYTCLCCDAETAPLEAFVLVSRADRPLGVRRISDLHIVDPHESSLCIRCTQRLGDLLDVADLSDVGVPGCCGDCSARRCWRDQECSCRCNCHSPDEQEQEGDDYEPESVAGDVEDQPDDTVTDGWV